MLIHNAVLTGSFSYAGADLSNISASADYSASLSTRTTNLETASGSFSTRLTAVSSSQQQISSSQQQISASLLNVIATGATTGSNSFRADQSITGSLVVSSTITAQTLVVQTVTSSIVYSSGSNNFGSALGDRQTFTGSVNITGSLTVNTTGTEFQVTNNGVVMGNLLTDSHIISGSVRINPNGLFVSGSGRVGINTTNPLSLFDVAVLTSGARRLLVNYDDSLVTIKSANDSATGESLRVWGDNIYFYTGSVGSGGELMRLTNTGRVGIGTSSPAYTLDVNGKGRFKIDGLSAFGFDILNNSGVRGAGFYNTGGNNVQLYFYNSGSVEKIVLDGGTGAAEFASTVTTTGVKFPATQVASADANTLDDYEEGTWTPTYTGTNITISSYGNRSGYYTKVGRLVTLTFSIMTEAVSVIGSELVNIGGLPFASANVTENANAVVIFDNSRWTSTPPVGGYVGVGTSTIALNSNIGNTGAGQDPTRVLSANMATGAGNRNMVRANVTYFTA